MIIVRSPLRITLGGGGTDLPSFYRDHEGLLIAAAIDKYVYITVHETFMPELIVKYSQMERTKTVDEVKHPLVREALKVVGITKPSIEITSMADIPAGTGLGSSGSFTTALLKALHAYQKNIVHASELAAQACHIEIERLGEPVGKQDQYISAYGGVTCFRFGRDDSVEAWPLRMPQNALHGLEDSLMLFFTGFSRSASSVLQDQDKKSRGNDGEMLENLRFIKELGLEIKRALEDGNLQRFADLMNVHWDYKKKRSVNISNPRIDEWYELARRNGALGGKLIGAGGGGFLMFYTENKNLLRKAMTDAGLREIRFRFDYEGTKVIMQ